MITPKGMFTFYAAIPLLLIGTLVFIAVVKIILENTSRKYAKSNKINRTIDISKCPIQTLETILSQSSNIHNMVRIKNDTLFFMDEYNAYIILFKNWLGNVIGEASDEKWLIKATPEYTVYNPFMEIRNILETVNLKINIDDITPLVVFNGLLKINIFDEEIESIKIDNVLSRIKKKEGQKKYSEQQINETIQLMCKEMSKGLHKK